MGFVRLISSSTKRGESEVDIVTDFEISHLKRLGKVQPGGVNKVVFVGCWSMIKILDVDDDLESDKLQVNTIYDKMEWTDLTYAYQLEILHRLGEKYQTNFDDIECNGQVLVDLINEKEVLFKDTIPQKLSYYIPRRFSTRYNISSRVFEQTCLDVFLFTGMERYELYNLTKNKLTDESSNQILKEELTVQYMIQDKEGDFDRISSKTSAPVHLLRYEDGRLRWIQSKRFMWVIQECIDMWQRDINEEDFFRDLLSDSNRVVCISGGSGMGKSVTLAHIGRILSRKFPNRAVHFIHLSEFISNFKKNDNVEPTANEVMSTLKEMVCENVIGETVLNSKLSAAAEPNILVELLLDGFDEVDACDDKLAVDIFQLIKRSFKTVRMWITTQPYLLERLEACLSTLGFNIQPFREDEQIQLLTSLWSCNASVSSESAKLLVPQYYRDVEILKIRLDDNIDIAEIPLRCHLIGEYLQHDIAIYVRSDTHPKLPCVVKSDFNTVASLYRRFIAMKLETYKFECGTVDFNEQAMMQMHVVMSMEFIFPKEFKKIQQLLETVQIAELRKVGIMKPSPDRPGQVMHRTLAEYFIACFVISILKDWNNSAEEVMNFILEHVLKCRSTNYRLTEYYFAHGMLTYFINCLIPDILETIPCPSIDPTTRYCTYPSATARRIIVYACANGNVSNILKFLDKMKAFDQYASTIFTTKFVLLAITNCELELVKLGMTHFEQHHDFDNDARQEFIRAAVTRGDLGIVKYLIKEKQYERTLKNSNINTTPLLHNCIKNTKHLTATQIEQRFGILQMLLQTKPNLLVEKNNEGATPLLSSLVHIELLKKIIQLGANILDRDIYGDTILHIADQFSTEEYHSILTLIPKDRLKIMVNIKGRFQRTPLMCAVRSFDPTPDTLTLFKDMGANFSCVDESGFPLLATAMVHRRNEVTLRDIAKYSANSEPHAAASRDKTLPHVLLGHIACPCCLQPVKEQGTIYQGGTETTLSTSGQQFVYDLGPATTIFASDNQFADDLGPATTIFASDQLSEK